jgi:hypothetical protein
MALAQAQLIQGSGEELLSYLEKHRDRKNLLLIIPQEKPAVEGPGPDAPPGEQNSSSETVTAAVVRNGVPLFPTQAATQKVTMELVKRLAEEE